MPLLVIPPYSGCSGSTINKSTQLQSQQLNIGDIHTALDSQTTVDTTINSDANATNPNSTQIRQINCNQLTCKICYKKYKTVFWLTKHYDNHTEAIHVCNKCNETFTSLKSLSEHTTLHNNPNKHVCQVCYESFATKSRLYHHGLKHFLIKNFICSICPNKRYSTNSSLKRHMKQKHTHTPNGVDCDICGKHVSTADALKIHKKTVHINPNTRDYSCDICNKLFKHHHHLVNHLFSETHKINLLVSTKVNNNPQSPSTSTTVD